MTYGKSLQALSLVALVAGLAFLVGCSSSSGSTPVGVATTVAVSPTAGQAVTPGETVTITATVTTASSNTGVTWSLSGPGSLSSTTTNPVTYTAPGSVSANTPVVVTATAAANTSSTAYLPLTLVPSGTVTNTAPLIVNSGPAQNSDNIAFVSVEICVAGTTTCQTVDDVQVDTGSQGLRILQSAIPTLSLTSLTASNGNTIFNCVSFLDTSYLWGPVQVADIRINGEVAGGALIQTISSSNSGIPSACTNGGTINENTPSLLGANGIIGIGLEPTDCTVAGENFCDGSVTSSVPPNYFSCPSSGCSTGTGATEITSSNQVVNPVVLFATDFNGSSIEFPAISASPAAAASLSGTLTFGIGTQTNNTLGSATAFGLDTNDNFITLYSGQTLTASFIDSGSNALFFPSSILVCTDNTSFYCPAPPTLSQSATNEGATGTPSSTVGFSVDNADNLFKNTSDFAFATLAGPEGTANTCSNGSGSCTFDFGLPFFFGRTVFTAIDGESVSGVGTGPFWAY